MVSIRCGRTCRKSSARLATAFMVEKYISTSVDIGRKPSYLALNGDKSVTRLPPLVSIPMPLIIDLSFAGCIPCRSLDQLLCRRP